MKRNNVLQQKLQLLIIIAILIVCAGFVVISCGTDPQLKALDPEKGQYALDFSGCEGTFCSALFPIDINTSSAHPIDGRALTAEAWVKVKSASTTGNIMGRIDANGGITMLVDNNVPKFSIRHEVPNASSTDKIVTSNVSLVENVWTHIAGVLSNTAHDDTTDHSTLIATCASGVGAEEPHLDIYVNGTFAGCNTTGLNLSASPGIETSGIGVNGESGVEVEELDVVLVSKEANFNGIIDEVRIWGVERTVSEIQECMDTELGLASGTCSRSNTNLFGYVKFNEGTGDTTFDRSGVGSGLIEEQAPARKNWVGGWTLDAPTLTTAD
ncbi:MAG: LamG domain-containing protein [Candidatus Brocadiales bacterium]|nr:LamG domain-containing protein [Candidatus Brocadiales bacterium]